MADAGRRTLEALELERVLRHVAGFAATPAARERILGARPSRDLGEIRERLGQVSETGRFLAERPGWDVPVIPDAGSAIGRLAVEGSVLTPEEAAVLSALLVASATLAGDLSEAEGRHPTLDALGSELAVERDEAAAIDRAVDPEGRVLDGASRELGRIRRSLAGARNRVVELLERRLARLPDRHRVAGASVTIREGRYAIPVRREGMRAVGGYVLDESSSGATVFVEPPSAIAATNRLRALEREEAREERRVLRRLSDRLRPRSRDLARSLAALTEMDRRVALARAAARWEGSAPEMGAVGLRVVRGRHPLLIARGETAVPFDLELEDEERVVVVTGPNAGGKTVFLKAVGLASVLAQSGVVPPVGAGTRLPVFGAHFAEIGDRQSIADSLSTFSARLGGLRDVVARAAADALVLIDEPGTGTDPKEGEALARATVEFLAERGCTAVVTSHLGGLKRLAAPGNRIVNASMRFDGERMAPTYRFSKGRPGRSYGLAISRALGLPEEFLDRAEAHRDRADARMDALLASLEAKERTLGARIRALEEGRAAAERLRADLEERERELGRLERRRRADARASARRLLLDARREVDAAIAALEERARDGESLRAAARQARRRVETAAEALTVDGEDPSPSPRRPSVRVAPPALMEVGTPVRMVDTGARGTVVAVDGRRADVRVGGLRLNVSRERLAAVEGEPIEGAVPRVGSGAQPSQWSPSGPEPLAEVDLRGMRADEAEASLLRALDRALVIDLGELRIVHGKGTGALKGRVAAALGRDARVRRFRPGRPGEGGGGVTVARLGRA